MIFMTLGLRAMEKGQGVTAMDHEAVNLFTGRRSSRENTMVTGQSYEPVPATLPGIPRDLQKSREALPDLHSVHPM
jgi:hypothetical protein